MRKAVTIERIHMIYNAETALPTYFNTPLWTHTSLVHVCWCSGLGMASGLQQIETRVTQDGTTIAPSSNAGSNVVFFPTAVPRRNETTHICSFTTLNSRVAVLPLQSATHVLLIPKHF